MNRFKKPIAAALIFASFLSPFKASADAEAEAWGTLIGGVGGGFAGNQFGHGEGKVGATIGGVILGAIIGNLVGRSIGHSDSRELPEIRYDELKKRGDYRFRTSDIFVHVWYKEEVYPLRPGFRECMEYDVYARIEHSRGRIQKRYACLTGDGWVEVSRNDVTSVNPNPMPDPMPVPAPMPAPMPAPQTPVQRLVYYSDTEVSTVVRYLSSSQLESDRIHYLKYYLTAYGAYSRVLTRAQNTYFLTFFSAQKQEARDLMEPYTR
jgi:uncharacterized protein YcfJ